jgi:type IV pilus assembly protein PilN
VLAGGTAVIGLLLVGAMHTFYQRQIDAQADRNAFLKGEIAKLDQEIAEIDSLKAEIAALLARKQVIETLQRDRAQTVHLLDELVRQMPEGVYLSRIVQKGMRIDIAGYAQSNARVSTLMRNVDSSPWLERPVLIQVNAASVDKKRVSEFSMFLFLKRPVEVKPAAAPTPTAPAAAKK